MKILTGNFNTKLERDLFKPTVGNESIHQDDDDDNNNNRVRIVNFATSNNQIIKSIVPAPNFHKYTWASLAGKTHNQIYYI
jgi:hypothetical protein